MNRYNFGKAVEGGAPMSADEIKAMKVEHLHALKARLAAPPPLEQTDDTLSVRMAEELDYTKRLLETVEAEIKRRGVGNPALGRIEEAEALLDDLSTIVDAKDRCEGVRRADAPGLKARLLRRGLDGAAVNCDNQR